ncbi:hypothetical protein SISSUDRAFT_981034 [Sistotremastrum suecicum HHB10207 ss-3]|uniref:WW domain-containing protein n=1 Tax=Sistotremastrum suecicum HHB10207 ss-3 TaxID=1314776 RepID=A0A166GP30_9AGAM|nr:hypothetical protein SISSUDRAFT_981034 [Sistotremastrum suecicum HHB10207 ss-3]
MVAPPLPPGWTEHRAPNGQLYYYHAATKQSTYERPLPNFANLQTQNAPTQKKKEKPLKKTPIPGTDWLRVQTTEGNTFYTNTVQKQSVWTVPEDVKDAVDALERQERANAIEREQSSDPAEREIERVKAEVEADVKRKAEEELDKPSKKAKLEDRVEQRSALDTEEEELNEDSHTELEGTQQTVAPLSPAAESKEQDSSPSKASFTIPDRVDLSLDEAKALFMALLREKDINPLHPWDTSLPLFIADPRYALVPSVSARRDVFDEYCRERSRELRAAKVAQAKEEEPKAAFERLLREEVKSTRLTWSEWRKTWKKDRRFQNWGRDDREREKRFREYIRELGEIKRANAQKAEANFFALLKENTSVRPDSEWREIKRSIADDPRYEAVGSSTLREELFSTYLKTLSNSTAPTQRDDEVMDPKVSAREKKERRERAVKERESQVLAEKQLLDNQIDRSRTGLSREENEREFLSLLVDAVREPLATWESELSHLNADPRFTTSRLPMNQRLHLFHQHISRLREKHLKNLHAIFSSHAPSLSTPFTALPLSSIQASLPAIKLDFQRAARRKALEDEFESWQRGRTLVARQEFNTMLAENSFLEFWGRANKMGGEGIDGGVPVDEEGGDEEEGEGGGGKADIKSLAKAIDVREVQRVLQNDKRYIMFDHIPDEREQWVREYMAQLSAPKLSVHVA